MSLKRKKHGPKSNGRKGLRVKPGAGLPTNVGDPNKPGTRGAKK